MSVIEYILVSAALNVPFGIYRSRLRPLSVGWFVAIHLPIPLIFLTRNALDVSPWWIAAGITAAIVGQTLGARVLAPAEWQAIGRAKKAERAAGKVAPDGVAVDPASA